MVEIEEEIFSYLKNYITTNSIHNPKVLKSEPVDTLFFPIIILRQLDDSLDSENLDKTDQLSKLEYEIEIYAIDTEDVSKNSIISELKHLVDDVIGKHFGMNRRACNPVANIDRNVDRLYMRYNALVDENKIIFRR